MSWWYMRIQILPQWRWYINENLLPGLSKPYGNSSSRSSIPSRCTRLAISYTMHLMRICYNIACVYHTHSIPLKFIFLDYYWPGHDSRDRLTVIQSIWLAVQVHAETSCVNTDTLASCHPAAIHVKSDIYIITHQLSACVPTLAIVTTETRFNHDMPTSKKRDRTDRMIANTWHISSMMESL